MHFKLSRGQTHLNIWGFHKIFEGFRRAFRSIEAEEVANNSGEVRGDTILRMVMQKTFLFICVCFMLVSCNSMENDCRKLVKLEIECMKEGFVGTKCNEHEKFRIKMMDRYSAKLPAFNATYQNELFRQLEEIKK